MDIDFKKRRVGRLTRIERSVADVAEKLLLSEGFLLSFGHGSKHPGVFAEKDGKTYFLPVSNTPKIEHLETKQMQRKCRLLLAGEWRPQV